jgi:hypothetical protein
MSKLKKALRRSNKDLLKRKKNKMSLRERCEIKNTD